MTKCTKIPTAQAIAGIPMRPARLTFTAALMASVLAAGFTGLSPTDAQAQNFFERLFDPERHRAEQQRLEAERRRQALKQKATQVRVSSPRFLTYQADAWKTVSLATLAEVKTAAVETGPDEGAEGQSMTEAAATPVLTDFDRARPVLKTLRFKALPEVAAALETHYRERPVFIWTTDGEPNAGALSAMEALDKAALFALDPDDYAVSMPIIPAAPAAVPDDADDAAKEAFEAAELKRAEVIMGFEIELSIAVLTYILDAERGRIDPNRLSGYHDLPRHQVDLVSAARALQTAQDVRAVMESHHPAGDHFQLLKAQLAELRAQDEEDERIVIAPGTFLKVGRSSPEVANIVAAIVKNGSDTLKEAHAETLAAYDGEELYSQEIADLVKAYQAENDLAADGIVGKNTILALVGVTNADKIAKIELAMERSRWLPEHLGERHVMLNVPAFEATHFSPDAEPLTMRTVVGRKTNQTYFFYDTLEVVEYNPYWGVPYSIIINDLLPKLAADPSYLDRSGYEVTTVSGRQVSSASVDWYAVAAKEKSINVRQYPGRSNALGELKILFPNKHAIYMHDTPQKHLFKKDSRAYSAGCVRLEDPRAMAAAVLGMSEDHIASQIATGRTIQESVGGDIPVYVSYFTAWPNTEGVIEYHADVYDRDQHLLKALETTDEARMAARS
ncbi:peptidoglycan-binding protein [Roseibium aquae]|uniref:Peptidoglycan-binding protein n=1 Tax=Roseibium aquae TaxID=1323746 RepID=A0A916TLC5_9HYPH|nr:L,D-transpeptidase family protein [Roseibium aquae]GGB54086.1 peptidoglycan-binding protein [Roseibium aquae]